jgi:dihydrofolate synthase/folylpolyglutamate synthase
MSQRARFTRLDDWLAWQQTLHHSTIELGLDRVRAVLTRLNWRQPAYPVVIVGGTNGKGSCVALLESIYAAAGYRVGTFTSPHLIRYNERIRIAGTEISDAALIAAFERIDAARGDISLTFFEFNTLAALLAFETAGLDVMVLEVGMGGELDAVNVVDADVAIVASVALDHCEWLGSDVETIAHVKAGIFRPGKPALFGSRARPNTIDATAARIGARLLCLGRDFDAVVSDGEWEWRGHVHSETHLPPSALSGAVQFDNSATVLTAIECLQSRLPVPRAAVEAGLKSVRLAGRFQCALVGPAKNEWLFDVAHNPAAAATLADNLRARPCGGRTVAVIGMLGDKDIAGVVQQLKPVVDVWVVAGVEGPRALATDALAERLRHAGVEAAHIATSVAAACEYTRTQLRTQDRAVVFGSFHTVGPALQWLQSAA